MSIAYVHECWSEDLISPAKEVYIGLLPLDVYRRLAQLVHRLNFGCTFNNGECSGYNNSTYIPNVTWKDEDYIFSTHVGCCCTICKSRAGYWDEYTSFDVDQFEFMEKTFGRYGFWRRGKGCILPWTYRSPTCLTYKCHDKVQFSDAETLLIETIGLGGSTDINNDKIETIGRLMIKLGIKIDKETNFLEKIIDYCNRTIPEPFDSKELWLKETDNHVEFTDKVRVALKAKKLTQHHFGRLEGSSEEDINAIMKRKYAGRCPFNIWQAAKIYLNV